MTFRTYESDDDNVHELVRYQHRVFDLYDRIRNDPPPVPPSVGDDILFAGGLVGYGPPWTRLRGTVLELAFLSCKVAFKHPRNDEPTEDWIDSVLVTDILKAPCKTTNSSPKKT